MLSIQQLIKTLRKLQNNSANVTGSDLVKSLKYVAAAVNPTIPTTTTTHIKTTTAASTAHTVTTLLAVPDMTSPTPTATATATHETCEHQQQQKQHQQTNDASQQTTQNDTEASQIISLISHFVENGSRSVAERSQAQKKSVVTPSSTTSLSSLPYSHDSSLVATTTTGTAASATHLQRSQQIQNFYQQQLNHFHTQHNHSLYAKQKQTHFAMSSLAAAEPLALKQDDVRTTNGTNGDCHTPTDSVNGGEEHNKSNSSGKPCFNTGLGEILQFMELIGNLKHTKRTGWVLRDVNDCESISGHMYRMSMMTFLLDGSEGLNQIRCMELALVHDLAESLVGDITPFCGVSKEEKRAMEFKAMADICKLIEPRGKRIMELFEEYENGISAESKFVKDLDRLDMVMQAFEYEKRDNCLLKHQEFFDSTAGKFNHPFVKKLVNEIYEQRRTLAKARGATPPPPVHVPNMDEPSTSNGQADDQPEKKQSSSSNSS